MCPEKVYALTDGAEESARSTAADAVLLDGADGRLEALLILDKAEVVVGGQVEALLPVDGNSPSVDGGDGTRTK